MTVELTTPDSLAYVFEVDNLPLDITTDCDDGIDVFAEINVDVK